jgi:hypothetical protein
LAQQYTNTLYKALRRPFGGLIAARLGGVG